ncbi:branched-chain amino acid ABC transporter permease [Sinorhizobium meliloti]|jgi:branched-chain amino acid transport system permease protein|uniref:branched-chain amino acid ABC transporter permease n=1 Tax=Rhizobium meliloti TaxID=382 RepID=UPI000FDC1E1F|nr:branched-chain amino acid ABC transporter permease [Sinorhizobium meliloti]MDW9596512.1 branched-chain amino acid ABC transporter permease [Sinorhizobium meliloti]MDX0191627.1 branched-chain amino acid ABC transporter permease [Sinorhizobium meliloti]MQV06414.1 branched-chain amino acid ABC transporter permease [Sinorhizobium meliloti]MQV62468.1 branched-chain amino acid ABC transporter permease [Sinorhizobium meliloti]RVG73430.1 branched-chain amino acid ABC transporter permease [Sinorhizo
MKHSYFTALILIGVIVIIAVGSQLLGIRLYDRIATNLLISLVLVIGLQTFMGNSGLLSFAHIGFMGLGAYTSAVLTIPAQMKGMALPDLYEFMKVVEVSPLLAMLAAGVLAAVVAAIVAYPLMRLSDAASVITSFALLVVLYTVMNNWSAFTNGPRTLFGLPKTTDMPVAAIVAAIVVVVALAFKESRTGKLLRASREDEVAAAALGADIPQLRWRAFILAAFIAGIGGALWGHFITSFAPKAFYLKETFLIITMLVIGGANTVTGAVAGTILVTFAYEGLRGTEGALNATALGAGQVVGLTEIVLALAMIAVMIVRPGGLFPNREIGHILTRARRKKETVA